MEKKAILPPSHKEYSLVFEFCSTKSVVLASNEIHLIKIIPSMKKILYIKIHRTKQILSRCYFSSSNAYAGQNSKFRKYSDNSSEIQNT